MYWSNYRMPRKKDISDEEFLPSLKKKEVNMNLPYKKKLYPINTSILDKVLLYI